MATETVQDVTALGLAARKASRKLARLSTEDKNRVLLNLAGLLRSDQAGVLAANAEDYQEAKADGLDESLLDRLLLTSERLNGTADELQRVAELPDPIGEVIETSSLPNGLIASRRRVPLGVVGSIYESRPNVTADAGSPVVALANLDPSADDYHSFQESEFFNNGAFFPGGATLQERFSYLFPGLELNSLEAQRQIAEA